MSSSISRQLVLWLAVPLMLLALCSALGHYFSRVAPEVITSDRRLRQMTEAIIAHIQIEGGRVTLAAHGGTAPDLPSRDAARFAVRALDGRLMVGDADLPWAPIPADRGPLTSVSRVDQRNLRLLTTPFDSQAGRMVVTVADLQFPTDPAVRYEFVSTLLWDFVQLDATLVLVWVGIRLGLRPVKRLRDDIAARSPQDLRPIDQSVVPSEIVPVVITLNRLFATLRGAAQSQQQFIANTAHQLRTPLTGLQAQLDLLLAEPDAGPITSRLTTLQEGIRQLAHSANQLLTLARADPAVNLANKTQVVSLDGIVREVVARFIDRALLANIDLGIEVAAVNVAADPALLDDLLSNLVDNALKYTRAGGSVTVGAGRLDGKPFLAVDDTGPGIPQAEWQRVRQRFYRLPNSPGHGSGLGLAIADEIAQLYGASLRIGAGSNGCGTRASVQFP